MKYKLKADLVANAWGTEIVLPKGTAVIKVQGDGGGFTIASESLLAKLTGNTHDPHYRFLWVKPEHVEEEPKL